jgi:galactonate dehydratase
MRITRLETIHLKPRWMIVRVHTDKGLVGLGEPSLEGHCQTVERAIAEMGRWLVGQDPRRIEHIWQHLYRGGFYRGGPVLCSAISGLEMALWDILGKHLKVPVHQLLGGAVRDRIRMYRWTGLPKNEKELKKTAAELKKAGFTAYKLAVLEATHHIETPAVLESAVARFAALRRKVGSGIDLAVDFHGRATPAVARTLARMLEPYRPMFIEEPVLPHDADSLRDVATSTCIPIATGERLMTRWQFAEVIEKRAVAVVQPDTSHVGGIYESRKVAAMAEPKGISFAPHCPLGPVSLAACLQLDACTPNFLIQEHVTLGADYLKKPFVIKDGFIAVPQGPGLGIELDEARVRAGRFDGSWDTPQYHLEDGSFAEW